jgi:hypothetical protein
MDAQPAVAERPGHAAWPIPPAKTLPPNTLHHSSSYASPPPRLTHFLHTPLQARLYVRHTLPLRQARTAMVDKQSEAAVVVDDNFTPMGLVFVEDIEAELVKQQLLLEPDNNFGRPS